MDFNSQAPKTVVISAGVPSSAGPFYFDMKAMRHFDVIADWTGTLAGTFKIEAGGAFDGPDRVAQNPGKWTDITASAIPAIVNPAGAAGSTEISVVYFTGSWLRFSLNGITGSGTLTLALTSKQ